MKSGSILVNNEYPIWVYENTPLPLTFDPAIKVSDRLDQQTLEHLSKGGTVILFANADLLIGSSVPGFFTPDFWCWPMFGNPSGIMGFLVNPEHPALASFPSSTHTDWQWFDIAVNSTPIILDEMPAGYRPIVQVIDNFDRSHRLALVDGFLFNGGRILFVAAELSKLEASIPGRAFVKSLHAYALSDEFQPTAELPERIERRLFEKAVDFKQAGVTATATTSEKDLPPSNALDGDAHTRWSAADEQLSNSWQVDLGREANLSKITIEWEHRGGYRCKVEGSKDGDNWQLLAEIGFNALSTQEAVWDPQVVRFLRITPTQLIANRKASIREVRLWEQARD